MRALLALLAPLVLAELSLDVREIRALGESGDVWNVPVLERVFDEGLEKLSAFPEPLYPADLEEETIAALEALARLDESSAVRRAREALEIASTSPLAWSARGVLARAGDLETIRFALASYFDAEDRWHQVLSASDDLRLADFRPQARPTPASPRVLSSTLEKNLSRARGGAAVRALVLWAEASSDVGAPRRVLEALPGDAPHALRVARWLERNAREQEPEVELSFDERGEVLAIHRVVLDLALPERARVLRFLAETDHPALVGLPMSGDEVDRAYAYLAPSRHRAVRERVVRTRRERGRALASLVLSSAASVEEKRSVLVAMRDAWAGALASGARGLADAMIEVVGEDEMERFAREEVESAALARVPLPAARRRLEAIGSAAAVESLMSRPDRILSMAFFQRVRTGADVEAARAAELALLALGGPGSSAFLRRELAAGKDRDALLGPALGGSSDPALLLRAVTAAASEPSPSPSGFAALARFHEREPALFLASLRGEGPFAERAHFVLSLSGEPRRIPLLVDLAVGAAGGASDASREAAFTGLAEADLGSFAPRLHRLAGDSDRAVRFRAAAALVPSGEPWTLRLLLGELDRTSEQERRIARRAVERLPRERARELVGEMVSDGTAGSFGVLLYLDMADTTLGRDLRERLWTLVSDDAKAGEEGALLAASRLDHPEAIAAVTRFLTAPESAW